jgi:DNA-binding SARP family transcriptional activator
MVCYQHLGQQAEAVRVYKRCRDVLSATLGIEPSSKTVAIYKSLLDAKAQSSNDK